MFVVTIDQRNSRKSHDRVPELLRELAHIPARLPFERTVGDEVQGVLMESADVLAVAFGALRLGGWYIGIGVGTVDNPLPQTSREAGGPAFIAARSAVERAKKSGDRIPLAVDGSAAAADAEAVLVLIGALIVGRSVAEWRILDKLQAGVRGGQTVAARKLSISPQAVSKAVLRSSWQEEWAARPAAAFLLDRAAAEIESKER